MSISGQPHQNNDLQLYQQNSLPSPLESSTSFHQRITIATKTDSLSSGFPYHPRLHDLKVSLDEWHLFTSDILKAGKLTPQEDYAAWSTGVLTGTLTIPLILVFGPVAGYYAGKSVHKKVLIGKVKERLLQDGDMRSVLRRWNERAFMEKGFQAWLELPVEGDPVPMETVKVKKTKEQKKIAKKEKRRFKIVIIPNNDKPEYSWSSAGSSTQTPVVPFVEAPMTGLESPVELQPGSSDHIQPLVNHQVAISSEGDRKYEYRPVPPETRSDHDTTPTEEAATENNLSSPSTEVANGRIPTSEMIPDEDKKGKTIAYPSAFEMDST